MPEEKVKRRSLSESANRLAEWGKMYSNEKFSYRAKSMEKRIMKLEAQRTFEPRAHRAEVSLETSESASTFLIDKKGFPFQLPTVGTYIRLKDSLLERGSVLP